MTFKITLMAVLAAIVGGIDSVAQTTESSSFEVIETDDITPTQITHGSEQILNSGQLEQDYNYLVYEFETATRLIRARSYLDEIESVSLFGPFAKDDPQKPLYNEPIDQRVIDYLYRRYLVVERFGPEGYVPLSDWTYGVQD